MRFRTTIAQTGTNTTGIRVPPDVIDELGAGRRPAVRVTVNGHTYRSTVATMGGELLISLSAENRSLAGVAGGDEVEVDVEVDDQPREAVVPPDLAEALAQDSAAKQAFDALSPSNQRRHVLALDGAKKPETRQRRLERILDELRGR